MDSDQSSPRIRLDGDELRSSQPLLSLCAITCDSPSSTYISTSPATPFIPLLKIGPATGEDGPPGEVYRRNPEAATASSATAVVPGGRPSSSRGNTKAIVSASQIETRGQGVVALESSFKPHRTPSAPQKIKTSPQGNDYSLGDLSVLATEASSLASGQSRKADVETSLGHTDALGLFAMGSELTLRDPAEARIIEDWWQLYTTLEDSNTEFPPLDEVTGGCDPFPDVVWKKFSPSFFGHFDSESFRRGRWRQKTFGPSFHLPRYLSPSHPFSMVSFVRGVWFADILPFEEVPSEVADAWFWETIQLA